MLAIKLAAIALIVVSQVLDWHSTLAFLKSGKGVERNTWLRWVSSALGRAGR